MSGPHWSAGQSIVGPSKAEPATEIHNALARGPTRTGIAARIAPQGNA
jgi:hypothetical protein